MEMERISQNRDIQGKTLTREEGTCHMTGPLSTLRSPIKYKGCFFEKTQLLSGNCVTITIVSSRKEIMWSREFQTQNNKAVYFSKIPEQKVFFIAEGWPCYCKLKIINW